MTTRREPAARRPRIRPYSVRDSGETVADILVRINESVYAAHGPDLRARGGAVGVVSDSVAQYERLLRDLNACPRIECLPFRELVGRTPPPDRVLCGIRHDIDVDITAALVHAELEQRHGIRSTWFVLHTAPYYGYFADGCFRRHDAMRHVYRRFQQWGHEVAVHSDPLLVYQAHGMDGAKGLCTEIDWLREAGIDVVGTTAHNSVSVYGAANFAIFEGRPRSFAELPADCPTEVFHDGSWSPLGVLREASLGLAYEANDVFWQAHSPVRYGVTSGVNSWWWETEKCVPRLRKLGREERGLSGFLAYEEILEQIQSMPGGSFLVLVVHPVYYGARAAPRSGPAVKLSAPSAPYPNELGWLGHTPHCIDARHGVTGDGRDEYQAVNMTNERGMLDWPGAATREPQAVTLVVFGGRNVDGAACGLAGHFHHAMRDALADAWKCSVVVEKYAYAEIGMARYFAWYMAVRTAVKPDVVVLGIGADELTHSLPEFWSRRTGFSRTHAPGSFLDCDDDGNVRACPGSSRAHLHRGRADEAFEAPSLARPATDAAQMRYRARLAAKLGYFIATVREDGAIPVLLLQECGESIGAWWGEDTTAGAMQAAHRHVLEWLQPLARNLDVALIDPYAEFLAASEARRAHWRSSPDWSYAGHAAAARVAARVIGPLRAPAAQVK
jgi:hypothetical protein